MSVHSSKPLKTWGFLKPMLSLLDEHMVFGALKLGEAQRTCICSCLIYISLSFKMKEGGKSEGFSFMSWTEHLILWSLILHGEERGEKKSNSFFPSK